MAIYLDHLARERPRSKCGLDNKKGELLYLVLTVRTCTVCVDEVTYVGYYVVQMKRGCDRKSSSDSATTR
jgi:hypothetical protein